MLLTCIDTMILIGRNDSLGEEVMSITIRKNCPGEEVMAHNLPLLYGSFIQGWIYVTIKTPTATLKTAHTVGVNKQLTLCFHFYNPGTVLEEL